MPDDLTRRLATLRQALADGDLTEAEYQAKLNRLRSEFGAPAVDQLLASQAPPTPTASTRQSVQHSTVGVMLGGTNAGTITVYLNGYRPPERARLLAAYLERLARDCDRLPLHALADAGNNDEPITLSDIYTELATTRPVARENLRRADLDQFDAAKFAAQHLADDTLPYQRRTRLKVARRGDARAPVQRGEHGITDIDLELMDADDLAKALADVQQAVFVGPQLVSEALAANQRLVLLGEPGSGKSTALRHLAQALARAGLRQPANLGKLLPGWGSLGEAGKLLPVYAPLLPLARQLAQASGQPGAATLWNYLASRLEGALRPDAHPQYPGLAQAVAEELRQGSVLLLLDGLDEVAGTESRQAVTATLLAFAAEHRNCRMVVACRVRAYQGEHNRAWQLPGWETATLADWTAPQMHKFVDNWYQVAGTTRDMSASQRQQRAHELNRALVAREDLRRLGRQPLLLTIMALVHLTRDLPENRADLYRVCIDKLLAEWEKRGKEDSDYGTIIEYIGLHNYDVTALLPLLRQTAFIAQQASSGASLGSIGRDQLMMLVIVALKRLAHTNPYEGSVRFLEYTDHRAGLLQAGDAGDDYRFPHQTFQEYLAGVYLVGMDDFVKEARDRRQQDRWRVPLQLALGHLAASNNLPVARSLLHELLALGADQARTLYERHSDWLLLADLAADIGWHNLVATSADGQRLKAEATNALAQVVEGSALPTSERLRAGRLLGDVGDPRPGVCNFDPRAFVVFEATSFVVGNTPAEYQAILAVERTNNDEERAKTWYAGSINKHGTATPLTRFELARYLVTNAQFGQFIAAGGYHPDAPWWASVPGGLAWLARDDATTSGLESWQQRARKDAPEWWDHLRFGQRRPNQPVVGISWYEAMAFCAWLTQHLGNGYSYRLPTEAEWEYAARGVERRVYPWGNQPPDEARANYGGVADRSSAVGGFAAGATPEKLYDLAGNAWEWTGSVYGTYPYKPDDGREQFGQVAEKHFTLRGGGWGDGPLGLRASNRDDDPPDDRRNDLGFRLARHLNV